MLAWREIYGVEPDLPSPAAMDRLIVLLPKMGGADAEELILEELYAGGFVISFDWPAWQEEALRYVSDPALIDSADLGTLCRLFTLHARKDRFCEGHFGAMVSNGHIAALTQRLSAIRDE